MLRTTEQVQSLQERLVVPAKTLLAKVIRNSLSSQVIDNRLHSGRCGGLGLANHDPKTISSQVARSQLVGVPTGLQHRDLWVRQFLQSRLAFCWYRQPLSRHGMPVFQAGHSNILMRDFQVTGNMAHQLLS